MSSAHTTFWLSTNVFCDIVGMFLFGSVVLVTLRQRKLHSPCHSLIGCYAFCGFLNKSYMLFPFTLYLWPGLAPIPLPICILASLLPVTLMHAFMPLMLAIGVDRLLSICAPFWYTTRRSKFYVPSILAACSLFPIYFAYEVAQTLHNQPELQPGCVEIGNTLTRSAKVLVCDVLLVVLTFACYIAAISKILLTKQQTANGIRQALFRSMAPVILIQVCAYVTALVGYLVVSGMQLHDSTAFAYLGCFLSLSMSAEIVVLYGTSTDHRNALNVHLGWLLRLLSRSNSNNNVGNGAGVVAAAIGGEIRHNRAAAR